MPSSFLPLLCYFVFLYCLLSLLFPHTSLVRCFLLFLRLFTWFNISFLKLSSPQQPPPPPMPQTCLSNFSLFFLLFPFIPSHTLLSTVLPSFLPGSTILLQNPHQYLFFSCLFPPYSLFSVLSLLFFLIILKYSFLLFNYIFTWCNISLLKLFTSTAATTNASTLPSPVSLFFFFPFTPSHTFLPTVLPSFYLAQRFPSKNLTSTSFLPVFLPYSLFSVLYYFFCTLFTIFFYRHSPTFLPTILLHFFT